MKDSVKAINANILIVDDIPASLNMLSQHLESQGYTVVAAPSGVIALEIVERTRPDLILLDIMMPEIDGFETCRRLKANPVTADIPVIFITAKDEIESIIEGFDVGGVDYITKPLNEKEVRVRVANHLEIHRLTQELIGKNIALQEEITQRKQAELARDEAEDARQTANAQLSILSEREAQRWGIEGFIGNSKTIERILSDVRQLQTIGTTSVLILGESGTGKELIARAIHFGGTRAKGAFIPLNCSAIPHELAESTLFGHKKGAFTGANAHRKGYFELADKGTLFLDEIGDMPIDLQAKLLRVLDDGGFTPIGSDEEKHVDVRVLAATNTDLQTKIANGAFREDLYYRLARFTVTVPPLRERKADIPPLVAHFLQMLAAEMGIGRGLEGTQGWKDDVVCLSPEALEALMNYDFPGNVRELKNIIEGALIKSSGGPIRVEHLSHLGEGATAPPVEPSEIPGAPTTRPALTMQPIHDPEPYQSEEDRILAYVRENESITNTTCRELLDVNRERAKYLLDKMQKNGLLVRRGTRRGTRYYIR